MAVLLPKLVCAWCNGLMRDGGLPVSHGMCPPCIVTFEQPAVSDVERAIEEAQRVA